jgi:hypothetical protein
MAHEINTRTRRISGDIHIFQISTTSARARTRSSRLDLMTKTKPDNIAAAHEIAMDTTPSPICASQD